VKGPGAIHITLGMVSPIECPLNVKWTKANTSATNQKYNMIFRNPNTAEGQTEPWINEKNE
jgi:hypothetical protein